MKQVKGIEKGAHGIKGDEHAKYSKEWQAYKKEEVKEDFKAGDKVKYVGDNPRYKDKTGTISHIATGKGPYNHLVTGIIKGAIAVDPKDLVKEEVEEAKTAGGALAQGHLETMTDQRFKEFYGMTKDEYIKKHGDPRKEELEESELNEALNINIVKGMTQRNDHFGARLYIAEQMRDKHMIAIYQGLGLAHDNYNRYVGNSALTVRQKLETVLKGKIVGTYGSAKGEEIIKAL